MKKLIIIFIINILTVIGGLIVGSWLLNQPVLAQVPPDYPIKVAVDNRHLVDQSNSPYLIVGDAGWSSIVQLSKEDLQLYLDNRQQNGFNTILINLLEHKYASNAPRNFYGEAPFTGVAFSSAPNEAYFAHADYVINQAAARGMQVLLDALYLGWECNDDGWCADVQAASTANLQTYGTYLGNRYKNFDNIIWVVGGDTDPTPVKLKMEAFAQALKAADGRHLITAHNDPEGMAVSRWPSATWLSLNNTYTYSKSAYTFHRTAYNLSPTKPYFFLESAYENADSTFQELRAQTYWAILSGANGHIFGNCPMWHFNGVGSYVLCNNQNLNWKDSLTLQGTKNMKHVADFFSTFAWQTLVPDWNHTTLTSGYGTWGQTDYVTAALASDGSFLAAYLPTVRTVTMNMAKFSAPVYAYWFDPNNGSYTQISGSLLSNSGTKTFTPSGNNSGGNGDWVLLLKPNSTNPTPIPPSPTPIVKLGDVDRDGDVDITDYNIVVNLFGNPYTIYDYNNVVSNYGT